MGNIVRWFEDFPQRALELLPDMETLAGQRDRIGSLSLLIAPALIVAPYERLQTYARRKNPQTDYLRFPDAHKRFDAVMNATFGDAGFWKQQEARLDWRGSSVPRISPDPRDWSTAGGLKPWEDNFWSVDLGMKETRWIWKFLRDALSHWNVVNSDREHRYFDESATMERLIFYRALNDQGPWDVISISPEGFLSFLKDWTAFLSGQPAKQLLKESEDLAA